MAAEGWNTTVRKSASSSLGPLPVSQLVVGRSEDLVGIGAYRLTLAAQRVRAACENNRLATCTDRVASRASISYQSRDDCSMSRGPKLYRYLPYKEEASPCHLTIAHETA